MVDLEKLASAFVSLSDTLVDDFDVLDLLYELVYACVEVLDASAAGLLLASKGGRLQAVATSSTPTHKWSRRRRTMRLRPSWMTSSTIDLPTPPLTSRARDTVTGPSSSVTPPSRFRMVAFATTPSTSAT
jgi:hypothetical protein